jgi:hypothetical protein
VVEAVRQARLHVFGTTLADFAKAYHTACERLRPSLQNRWRTLAKGSRCLGCQQNQTLPLSNQDLADIATVLTGHVPVKGDKMYRVTRDGVKVQSRGGARSRPAAAGWVLKRAIGPPLRRLCACGLALLASNAKEMERLLADRFDLLCRYLEWPSSCQWFDVRGQPIALPKSHDVRLQLTVHLPLVLANLVMEWLTGGNTIHVLCKNSDPTTFRCPFCPGRPRHTDYRERPPEGVTPVNIWGCLPLNFPFVRLHKESEFESEPAPALAIPAPSDDEQPVRFSSESEIEPIPAVAPPLDEPPASSRHTTIPSRKRKTPCHVT